MQEHSHSAPLLLSHANPPLHLLLKHPSLIKTWVLETCVFQIMVYILELSYFQGQIMKATEALKINSGCVFRGFFYCLIETQDCTTGNYGKFKTTSLISSDWRQGKKERKSLSLPHPE